MKLTLRLFSFLAIVVFLTSCKKEASQEAKDAVLNVIPKPTSVKPAEGVFVVTSKTTVVADKSVEGVAGVVDYLATTLGVQQAGEQAPGNQIFLSIISDADLGNEGYELDITNESITISANAAAGFFYATQTLRQLGVKTQEGTEFAAVSIGDRPSFGWRGSMLDVARHFFSVDDVKRYIDFLAAYKLNVLHLGLTNDQGWRIEIKSWPKLAEIGGKTQVKGGGGGFYTQEQYKDIVAYAQSKFITIIPEIDMPSHVEAALAAYPELSCDGRKPALYEGIEVGFNSLCPKSELVTKFATDVIREVASITPGPYIHVGGDEAKKAVKKDDYIKFIKTFKKIVEANNKYMVGWEEIAQSDIGAGDLVQYWHSAEHAVEGVQKGAKLIMSPSTKVYLDMKYDTTIKNIGYTWAALIEVDDSYNWKIEEMVPGVSLDNVAGVEAPLWSETLRSMNDIEFMLFPRLPGIAEIAWHYENRDWNEYKARLAKHDKFMTDLGIGYYKSPKVWGDPNVAKSPQ